MSFRNPEKHVKENRWNKQVICFYGDPGIGKSSIASYFEKEEGYAYFATEPGTDHLELNNAPSQVNSYKKFIEGLKELADWKVEGDCPYNGVIIDTTSEWMKYIGDWVCEREGVAMLGDTNYSVGYKYVRDEAIRILKKLKSELGMGVVLTCHSTVRQKEKKVGLKIKKWEQADLLMSEKDSKAIVGQCDLVVFMTTNTEEHKSFGMAYTKPGDFQIAKDRKQNSDIPYEISFNPANPRELYDKLKSYFD